MAIGKIAGLTGKAIITPNMRHYSQYDHEPAPCALEVSSRGANVSRGRVFNMKDNTYYKVTRDNLIQIAGKYREMISDEAEL